MYSIREAVFETNSSACHALTVIPKEKLIDLSKNWYCKCVYFPDTGDYQTSDHYIILDNEDAFKQYNKDHENQNRYYRERGYDSLLVKTYPETDDGLAEFEEDMEHGALDDDLGKYLSFTGLMRYAIIEHDMEFDIQWWNND